MCAICALTKTLFILRVTIGIATIPERAEALRDTLASLKGQADEVYVYLNGYDARPAWLPQDVRALTGPDAGDAGKFAPATMGIAGDVHVTCDDDLIYPPDFAQRLVDGVDKYGGAVSFHGRRQKAPTESYYRGPHEPLPCLGFVPYDQDCTVIGTGCMAFRPDEVPLRDAHFFAPNMADILFSRRCAELGVRRTVLAHRPGYIVHSEKVDLGRTIFAAHVNSDTLQTRIFNETNWL